MVRGSFSSSSWGPQRHTNVRTSCFADILSEHAAIATMIDFIAFLVSWHFCEMPAKTSRLASCSILRQRIVYKAGV